MCDPIARIDNSLKRHNTENLCLVGFYRIVIFEITRSIEPMLKLAIFISLKKENWLFDTPLKYFYSFCYLLRNSIKKFPIKV